MAPGPPAKFKVNRAHLMAGFGWIRVETEAPGPPAKFKVNRAQLMLGLVDRNGRDCGPWSSCKVQSE